MAEEREAPEENGTLGFLPWDVLTHVLGFHPSPFLTFPLLNSFYKDLAYNSRYYNTLSFFGSKLGDPMLKLAASHVVATRCTSLILTSAEELEEDTFLLFLKAAGEKLERLELGFMEDVDSSTLTEIGRRCPNLRCLNLEGTSVDDSVLNILGSTLPQLEELNLCNSMGVTLRGAKQLAVLTELKSLNLYGCPEASTEAILELSKNLHQMETFYLDGEESCGLALRHMGTAWSGTLTRLHINFCNEWESLHADEGLLTLRECRKLTVLKLLKGSCFSTEALLAFASEPKVRPDLVEIALTETEHLTDDVLIHLGKQCPNLQDVNFEWSSSISDRGLRGLGGCRSLRSLNLAGLKSIEADALEEAMEGMPHLRKVVLKNCNKVPEPRWTTMCQRVPHCVVVDYWGNRYIFDGETCKVLPPA